MPTHAALSDLCSAPGGTTRSLTSHSRSVTLAAIAGRRAQERNLTLTDRADLTGGGDGSTVVMTGSARLSCRAENGKDSQHARHRARRLWLHERLSELTRK
jgi:hypothetical protein